MRGRIAFATLFRRGAFVRSRSINAVLLPFDQLTDGSAPGVKSGSSRSVRDATFAQRAGPSSPPSLRPPSLFAVCVGRRQGNAVARNRLKRQVREALDQELPGLRPGYAVALLPAASYAQLPAPERRRALAGILRRAGLTAGSAR